MRSLKLLNARAEREVNSLHLGAHYSSWLKEVTGSVMHHDRGNFDSSSKHTLKTQTDTLTIRVPNYSKHREFDIRHMRNQSAAESQGNQSSELLRSDASDALGDEGSNNPIFRRVRRSRKNLQYTQYQVVIHGTTSRQSTEASTQLVSRASAAS